jgi:hypothetical protein
MLTYAGVLERDVRNVRALLAYAALHELSGTLSVAQARMHKYAHVF